jgi:hypothetical protein
LTGRDALYESEELLSAAGYQHFSVINIRFNLVQRIIRLRKQMQEVRSRTRKRFNDEGPWIRPYILVERRETLVVEGKCHYVSAQHRMLSLRLCWSVLHDPSIGLEPWWSVDLSGLIAALLFETRPLAALCSSHVRSP